MLMQSMSEVGAVFPLCGTCLCPFVCVCVCVCLDDDPTDTTTVRDQKVPKSFQRF